jgi:hypothetical protein
MKQKKIVPVVREPTRPQAIYRLRWENVNRSRAGSKHKTHATREDLLSELPSDNMALSGR